MLPRVAIVPAPPDRLDAAVRTAVERVDGLQALKGHGRVLLKPNLGWDLPLPGAVTNGRVIAATVGVLLDAGHSVTIIEADQVLVDITTAARQAGVFHLTAHPDVRWMNLSQGEFVTVPVPGAVSGVDIQLPRILTEHPIITLPVLKTHAKTVISGAIKNHWGLLPIDRYRLHPQLTEVLVDLIRAMPPILSIMDATVALEGNGPKSGRPRRIDHVLASTDPLALDATAARLMGIAPEQVPHLVALASVLDRDLSAAILGDLPEVAPFARADHNLVSRIEGGLNTGASNPIFAHPAAFKLMCAGARAWYHAWFHWGPGSKHRTSMGG
jgi:uncharacterized protein (DUF362 family)